MKEDKNNSKEEELILKKLEMIANIRKQHEWITMGQAEVTEGDNIEQELDDSTKKAGENE